jgi:hypothetical protein
MREHYQREFRMSATSATNVAVQCALRRRTSFLDTHLRWRYIEGACPWLMGSEVVVRAQLLGALRSL